MVTSMESSYLARRVTRSWLYPAILLLSLAVVATSAQPARAGSPTGTIAYTAGFSFEGNYANIDAVDPLSVTHATLVQPGSGDYADIEPAFSPDGTRLAYVAKHGSVDNGLTGTDLIIANADGSSPLSLTNTAAYEFAPTFTADGQGIVYERCSDLLTPDSCSLMLMKPIGANPERLMSDAHKPALSGKTLAFERQGSIYIKHLEGSRANKVAGSGSDGLRPSRDPSLSATGKYVAYSRRQPHSSSSDIFVKNLVTGTRQQLTTSPADDDSPSFSPDGNWLVFTRTSATDPFNETLVLTTTSGTQTSSLSIPGLWPTWGPG